MANLSDWFWRHFRTSPEIVAFNGQSQNLPPNNNDTVQVEGNQTAADVTFDCQDAEMSKVTVGLSYYLDAVGKCVKRNMHH